MCYHSGPEWTWEQWQWRGTPNSPKLVHHESLHHIKDTRWGVLSLWRDAVGVLYSPSRLGWQYTLPSLGLNTLTNKFTAAARIMQSSSNELSTLVSGKAKMKINKSYYIMPYNSRADVLRLQADRYDTKSNVKLGVFRSQLQASYVLATL